MRIWFTRSNGHTKHNAPHTRAFVPGEPPRYPDTAFNYRESCLHDGFARIGWPATGDLRQAGWQARGREIYSGDDFKDVHVRYLQDFASIVTGDLVVIPADRREHDVHVGVAVLRLEPGRHALSLRPHLPAYYYRHDVSVGDWFENAHRVDVVWDRDGGGEFGVYSIPELGGIWRRAFSAVREGESAIVKLAEKVGLLRIAE